MEVIMDAARRLTEKIGEVEKAYEYRDAEGQLLFCNLRIRQRDGKKTFRMMSDDGKGFELKRHESLKPHEGWPLYGLASLERPGPIWVVEGEKDVRSLYALGCLPLPQAAPAQIRMPIGHLWQDARLCCGPITMIRAGSTWSG